jgi:hypothetical protein
MIGSTASTAEHPVPAPVALQPKRQSSAAAKGRKVRNSFINPANLVALATNGGFRGQAAT